MKEKREKKTHGQTIWIERQHIHKKENNPYIPDLELEWQ